MPWRWTLRFDLHAAALWMEYRKRTIFFFAIASSEGGVQPTDSHILADRVGHPTSCMTEGGWRIRYALLKQGHDKGRPDY